MSEGLTSAKGRLHAFKCDLSKEEEILSMFAWITNNVGGVDVCINNAGFGDFGSLLGPGKNIPNIVSISILIIFNVSNINRGFCIGLEKYDGCQRDSALSMY